MDCSHPDVQAARSKGNFVKRCVLSSFCGFKTHRAQSSLLIPDVQQTEKQAHASLLCVLHLLDPGAVVVAKEHEVPDLEFPSRGWK